MQCVNDDCESTATHVVETYKTLPSVYRVRKCPQCGTRYTTIEVVAPEQEIPDHVRQVNRKML